MQTTVKNIPNLLSSFRLFAAPFLIFIAWQNMPKLFLALLAVSLTTDAVKGFVARRCKVTSETGARLGSWGDFITFIAVAVSAWWLWPRILLSEISFVVAGITSFFPPVTIGFIKFRKLTCHHTWATKIQA